jgi:hypothetical protein
MPQFGQKHDDAIYYITSKSVVEGRGYRILSLPGEPFEKYPPVLPFLLTIPWLLDSRFPQNLVIATAIQWAVIPPFLWLCLIWFRRVGLSVGQRWIATTLLAVSPYTVMFGAGIYTEILFCVFLLASLLACDEARNKSNGWRWAAVAGVLAGLSFLTRTAGIAAAVSGPIVFLIWRRRREAIAFALAILPSLAGWISWSKGHQLQSSDVISLYNTNYLGFALADVKFSDLGTITSQNISYLLYHIGVFLFPLEFDSLLWHLVMYAVAAAIIAGVVRHYRNPVLFPYAIFAVLTCCELVVWDWAPNLRLMYSLVPLLAAGIVWEAEHFLNLLRSTLAKKKAGDRAAGWAIGLFAAALVITGGWMQLYMNLYTLPDMISLNERLQSADVSTYEWIGGHVGSNENVLAQNPALYLYTGKKTASLVGLPIHWYHQDKIQMLAPFQQISAYAYDHKLDYVFLHRSEYDGLVPGYGTDAARYVASDPGLAAVFDNGDSTVYRLTRNRDRK